MSIENKMRRIVFAALSLVVPLFAVAQPFFTNMGGTYAKVTDYTQVKDKDIVILASHSTKDDKNEVRIMTTVASDQAGMFGFYTYSAYDEANGMPETITLSEVNKEGLPYEYAINWGKTQSTAQYLSLQGIDGKYIGENGTSVKSMSLQTTENKKSAVRNHSSSDYVILDTGDKSLYCWNNADQNGYFSNYGSLQSYLNRVDIYRKVYEVSFGNIGYSTFYYGTNDVCLPSGLKAYTYDLEGNKLTPNHEFSGDNEDVLPYSTAVILKGEPNTKYVLDVKNTQSENEYSNKLRGTDVNTTTQCEGDAAGSKYYLFANGPHGLGFYYAADGGAAFINTAHKAYLCLSPALAAQGFSFSLPIEGDPTGVESCKGVFENTSSDASNQWYDLSGRRVSQPAKGLYIRGGKTILVR